MLHIAKSKRFAERLNKCLDSIGVPQEPRNRCAILSKMLRISRPQTRMLIEGYQLPDETVLHQLETEFDVNADWLLK